MSIKKQLSRISPLSACLIVLFAAVMTYFIYGAFAASGVATLYTSPAGTQSATIGQTFAVNVRISTGSGVPVTGAAVYLSYPTDKLQVTGQSYAGSPYSTQLVESNAGGVLRMDRAAFPAVSGGDQLFAQVSFKALAAGSAPITFTNSSIVTSGEDDSNILNAKTGVTYTISAPATPPPATGGGTSTPAPAPSTGGTSGSTTKPSTSTSTKPSTGGSSTPAATTPGGTPAETTTTVTNPDGSVTTTTEESSGSTVAITIVDDNNKPVQGAEVTINGQTAKTDKNGIARFTSVPKGNQSVLVSYNGKKTNKVAYVKGASTQTAEQFKLTIPRNKFNPFVLLLPLLVLGGAAVILLRPWQGHFAHEAVGADADALDSIVTSDQIAAQNSADTKHDPGTTITPDNSATSSTPPEPDTPDASKDDSSPDIHVSPK